MGEAALWLGLRAGLGFHQSPTMSAGVGRAVQSKMYVFHKGRGEVEFR